MRARVEPFGWSVHMADAVTVITALAGSGTLQCRGEALTLTRGTAHVVAPLELLVVSTAESALEISVLHAPASLVPRRRTADAGRVSGTSLAEWLSARAEHAQEGPPAPIPDEVLELLADAGAARRGRVRQGHLEPGPVRRARTHLETHYGALPSLDELAATVGTSKFHLVRMFRAYHGVPPHTYLICYRLAIARRMISQGEKGADTALATGFADQSHFSRSFRRMVGMSPVEYARLGIVRPVPRSREAVRRARASGEAPREGTER